jgi:hypothetical protein
MTYSVKVSGMFQDLSFRNRRPIVEGEPGCFYSVYVGEEFWGSVYDMGGSWTAVAWRAGDMNMVDGFKRRMDAAKYVIAYMQSTETGGNG